MKTIKVDGKELEVSVGENDDDWSDPFCVCHHCGRNSQGGSAAVAIANKCPLCGKTGIHIREVKKSAGICIPFDENELHTF